MLEKIALILDFAPFAVIFLIVACYNTHAIPRAMAKRIARREDSWDRDTVEEDHLGVLLFLTPPLASLCPGSFAWSRGSLPPPRANCFSWEAPLRPSSCFQAPRPCSATTQWASIYALGSAKRHICLGIRSPRCNGRSEKAKHAHSTESDPTCPSLPFTIRQAFSVDPPPRYAISTPPPIGASAAFWPCGIRGTPRKSYPILKNNRTNHTRKGDPHEHHRLHPHPPR